MYRKLTLLLIVAAMQVFTASARWNGKKYIYAEAAVLKEVDYFESYQAMLNTGVEYIGNPLKSFGVEMNIWQYREKGYNATGIGLRPMTKYYLWRTRTYRIFIEIKGGVIYMTPEYPVGGSQFNFTLTGSVGTDLRLTDKTKLLVAARYNHMSNWNLYGEDNNPTWDGVGVTVGMIWLLR